MTDTLFPIAATPLPPLQAARHRLSALEARRDALLAEVAEARLELTRVELEARQAPSPARKHTSLP